MVIVSMNKEPEFSTKPDFSFESKYALPILDFRSVVGSTGHEGGGSPSDPVSDAFLLGMILGSGM
mgnify:CR=1 FL=1